MTSLRTAFLVAFAAWACSDSEAERGALREVRVPDAPEFVHEMPADSSYYMPESTGSGLAFLDFDGDGDLDIYAVNGASRAGRETGRGAVNRLFRRDAEGYVDVTEGSGLGDGGFGMGVAAGDMDNDGWVDVFVTNVGPDALYRNAGGTFVNVTSQAGISDDAAWSTSATFLDYDADGWLDLFVVYYVALDHPVNCSTPSGAAEYCGPLAYLGAGDRLYRNLGGGVFEDVTQAAGIGSRVGRGLGVVAEDFDQDGFLDIYVSNDGGPNFLWHNLGDGRFEEVAVRWGVAVNGFGVAEAGMGIAVGDVDGDGFFDIFVTHLGGESNTLYRNDGAGSFQDETLGRGLHTPSLPFTGFGTGMFDLDNDGDLDILVVNGRINRGPAVEGASDGFFRDYAEPNSLFLNDGEGVFRDVSAQHPALTDRPGMSRGLAFGDFDNDGAIDVIIMETGRGLRLLRNESAIGHWIGLRVTDPDLGGRDVIGAQVTLWWAGNKARRSVNPGYSFLSSNDPRVHFGLGSASTFDSLLVRWPGGEAEKFGGGQADEWIAIERGKGESR